MEIIFHKDQIFSSVMLCAASFVFIICIGIMLLNFRYLIVIGFITVISSIAIQTGFLPVAIIDNITNYIFPALDKTVYQLYIVITKGYLTLLATIIGIIMGIIVSISIRRKQLRTY